MKDTCDNGGESPPLVLVADDDPAMRFMATEVLVQEGFQVSEAENGVQALAAIEAREPQLLLLDVIMPEMDGFTVCAALRRVPHTADIPVLMMTGLDDVESIDRAYEAGATDFLTKPINYALLGHRVRYMLRTQQAAEALRRNEHRLANAQRIAQLGYWDWDVASDSLDVSDQVCSIFMLERGALNGRLERFLDRVHADDRAGVEKSIRDTSGQKERASLDYRIRLPNGEERIVHQESEAIVGDGRAETALSGTIQDITERTRNEEAIFRLAHFDELTGLPNRRFLKDHLAHVIEQVKRHARCAALLALDIDRFQQINESLGHGIGDILLKEMAARLVRCMRSSDCISRSLSAHEILRQGYLGDDAVARIDGDEFIVLLSEIHQPEDAVIVARRVLAALSDPYMVKENEIRLSASIGIVLCPDNGGDADTLLRNADAAMHHAKDCGRNNIQFFSESVNTRALERLTMQNDLRKALEREEFVVYYQPKVDVRTRKVVGMEALVRWRHPRRGMISPVEFIPMAEEFGFISALGEWVFRHACEQALAWSRAGLAALRVSVNLSADQFKDRNLARCVDRWLKDIGINPGLVELELTESLLMGEMEANIGTMNALKRIGIRLSIDDFGTGYSSLSYLRRFPIDTLKIDRAFIKEIDRNEDAAAIVKAIIDLAHSLRLSVVAEGAEHKPQVEFLRANGCDEIQGYYYARPLPADEFYAWTRARETDIRLVTVG